MLKRNRSVGNSAGGSDRSSKKVKDGTVSGDLIRDVIFLSKPKALLHLIGQLNSRQRDDIKNIGFGGLLHLNVSKCQSNSMLNWLVQNFNTSSRILDVGNGNRFVVTDNDIYDVFMLPRNEGRVLLSYGRHDCNLLHDLENKYNIRCSTSVTNILKCLKHDQFTDDGSDFQRLFVLLSLSTLLTPSSNHLLCTNILKSVEVVEDIKKYDWCTYVLESLCSSISEFKQNVSVISKKNSFIQCSGCVLILQILYFHRVMWRGENLPCALPLISHWTDYLVESRCLQEAEAGKFGDDISVLNKFPLSRNGILNFDVTYNQKIMDLHEIADSLTKDICAVSSIYMSRLIDFKKSVAVAQSSQSTPEYSETMSLDSQSLKLADDLVANFKSTKAIACDIGNFVNEDKRKNSDNVKKCEDDSDVNVRKVEGSLSDDDIAFFSLLSSLNDDLWNDSKEDGDGKSGPSKKINDVSDYEDDAPTFHLLS